MNTVVASQYGSSSIYTSYDGINDWSELPQGILDQVYRFGYNPVSQRWIAVGAGSSNNIMYSDIYPTNWTGVGGSIFNQFASSVLFNGTVWMVTGQDRGTAIAYSTNDGLNWTTVGSSDSSLLNMGRDLAWNPKNGTNGRWVVAGSNITASGVDMVYSDNNGTSWTPITTSVVTFVETIESVVYSNGTPHWVVGARTGGSNTLAWSSDGINWTGATFLNLNNGQSVSFDTCIDVKWNGSIWVAISTTQIVTSTDGKIWTLRDRIDIHTNNILQQLFWTGDYWVITFNAQSMNNIGIAYTTDPINITGWTSATPISGYTIPAYMYAVGGGYRVKNYQTLTFNAMTKSIGDAAFTPTVSTDAKPSYSAYSFSVPGSNGVATVNGSQLNIIGPGTVTVTVTQAANDFFEQATSNAVLTVSGATSSGILEAGYEPSNAFDNNNNTFWHSMDIRNTVTLYPNGMYQGSISTSLTGYSSPQVSGEWLQIQLPNAIYLSSFSITPRAGYEQTHSPEDFVLCASTDGTQFELIQAYTGQTYNTPQTAKTFYVSPSTQYSYFRIVVTKCGGGGQAAISASVQIAEWKLYASADPSQVVSFSSNAVTVENAQVDDTISLTGRATSATSAINPIQYSLYNTASSVAIISGTDIVIKGRGLITLQASQPSGNNYSASNVAEQLITVNFPQTVSFSSNSVTIENAQVDDTISLTGRATSATSGTNAIQYSLVNTSVNVAIISGTNIVIKGRGLITLRASQPSGNFYSVSNDADQTITVNFPQTISFDAGAIINKNYGNAPFTPSLSTTASPSYSSYTFSVPSNNGIVTTNGSLLTIVGVGTVTVTATQASANYYSSASATVSLVVDKGTQTLTFDKFSRLFGIDPFTPTVTTNASPSYSAYTFSVPSENTVARTIHNSTQLEIIGIGRVLVTVTQAENELYYSASATTRFTVKVNLLKSVYINLIDRTNTREFAFVQDVGPTYFVFPTTANFRDYTRKFIVSDVLDYFERVDMLESHIQLATSERNIIDTHQSAVEHFLASNESDIQQLENRLDTAESDLQIWDLRVDSNTERISTNETIWSGIESQIDTLETEYSELETNLLVVEGRISIQETDIDQLVSRADSNTSRITLDQTEWSGLETRINVLDSRQTNTESELTLFSSHLEIQVENSITSINQRLTTDQSLLQQFSNHLESVESDIDVLQSRTSLTEVDLVHLDNVFTGYESTLDSTKQTLYAISDGNLESMLSSLQQIQTEFTESVQVENIIELRERLNDLDSVLKELLETP